jgi:integrase
MQFLSRDEFGLLLAAIPPHYKLLVETMVATGLRWGEITALTVADCNLSAKPPTVRVNKAWKRDGENRHYVGSTKSARGRRTVSVPSSLVPRLTDSLRGKKQDDLVFVNRLGGEIRHNTFWWKTWRPALKKAQNPTTADGSPDLDAPRLMKTPRIHDLRHTHASWMIAQGTDLMVLQRRLGHESITTTVDRYSHLLPQQHIDAAAAAERALYGDEGEAG